MRSELWEAVLGLATTWTQSQTVREVSSVVPRLGSATSTGMTSLLADLGLRGLRAHPLRFASEIDLLLAHPINAHLTAPKEYSTWFPRALSVEAAFRDQIAWLRAQLPGYPMVPAPQLVAGAPLTFPELPGPLEWSRHDMARGWQLSPPPSFQIGRERLDATAELRLVANVLRASEPWQQFDATRAALQPADVASLRSANSSLRAAVSLERVAEHEPHNGVRRLEYRQHQLESALATLTGNARVFAEAFATAADTVDFAVDDVLPQLVIFGRPGDIVVSGDLDFLDDQTITFATDTPLHLPGQLSFVPDPLVEEVGQVTEVMGVFEPGHESTNVTMRLIPGAAASWGL